MHHMYHVFWPGFGAGPHLLYHEFYHSKIKNHHKIYEIKNTQLSECIWVNLIILHLPFHQAMEAMRHVSYVS